MSSLFEAGRENTYIVLSAYNQHGHIKEFILDEELRMPILSTTVEPNTLDFLYDIDGVVIQLNDLSGVVGRLHYLFLPELKANMLVSHFNILKKHLKLSRYTVNAVAALRNCCGYSLAHVERGYFLNLTVVPRNNEAVSDMFLSQVSARVKTAEILNEMVANFKRLLRELPPEDMDRPSIQKACFYNLSRMNVLAADQPFLLTALQRSMAAVGVDGQTEILVTLTQFGQKTDDIVVVEDVAEMKHVTCVSLHTACTLRSRDDRVHLLWSRNGVQEVVGTRGTMYSALAMNQTANFFSNLDHRQMDIHRPLLDVFRTVELNYSLNYVQLYAITPHARMPRVDIHPVSWCIGSCGLGHPRHQKASLSRAATYITHMADLNLRMVSLVPARLEQVGLYETDIPSVMEADNTFSEEGLCNLLRTKPMLVPLSDEPAGHGVIRLLRGVVEHMTGRLRSLLDTSNGKGGYDATWSAYQLEVALEELFYGHPSSLVDFSYSVSLGCSSTNANSVTCQRGFVGLAPASSASAGLSPPPLRQWTANKTQQERIRRLFAFSDAVNGGPAVVGSALVTVLLCDLFERNERIPMGSLQQDTCPGTLKGSITDQSLCESLVEEAAFVYPHTFCRAKTMASEAGQDVLSCLKAGFAEHQLRYFPHLRHWSIRGNRKVSWNFRDYWEVHSINDTPSAEARAVSLVGDICVELEKRGLCYEQNMQKYAKHGMPWLAVVLRRLGSSCGPQDVVKVTSFVSCIAMIQNGDYISFEALRKLLTELPVTQQRLQSLHVLSCFLLPIGYRLRLWGLHESIPRKLAVAAPRAVVANRTVPERPPQPVEEPLEETDWSSVPQDVARQPVRCLPASSSQVWSSLELGLIDLSPQLSHRDAYTAYVKECERLRMAVRSFRGFCQKRTQMLKARAV